MKILKTAIAVFCLTFGLNSCIADLSKRVDSLEEQVSIVLSSVEELRELINKNVYVVSYKESENGYILSLSNGETMLIRNGEDGKSVVEGINGIESVEINDDFVIFTLSDGGSLALARSLKELSLEIGEVVVNAYDAQINFSIKDAADPYVVVYSDSDVEIEVSEIENNSGSISIKKGEKDGAKIYATVIDNASAGNNTNTRVVKVDFESAAFNAELNNASLPSAGGSFSFNFSTNVPFSIEVPEWASIVETKAIKEYTKTIEVAANTNQARSSEIRIINDVNGELMGSFELRQKGSINYVYVACEGSWGMNNASVSRYDIASGKFENDWFASVNGQPLGDTANDILITEDYIIYALNSSNIIQFCDLDGKKVAQIEDVPNCRKMATDAEGNFLYVTSYANDGYVAKISLTSFEVSSTVKVGYEPEGIVWYNGKLFVANSGGNAYLGNHDYEDSISIINADTMEEESRINTGCINLYGAFIQNSVYPRYILVNSAGDYNETPAMSLIFDCESQEVVEYFDFPATYASEHNGVFYSIGSAFDYSTYAYTYYIRNISISSGIATASEGISEQVDSYIKSCAAPYGFYIASDGQFFVSDAGNYSNRGSVTIFSADGEKLSTHTVGICPSHFAEN